MITFKLKIPSHKRKLACNLSKREVILSQSNRLILFFAVIELYMHKNFSIYLNNNLFHRCFLNNSPKYHFVNLQLVY